MREHASTLPLHGGLVEIANRIAKHIEHVSFAGERFSTYRPVTDGSATCPTCHVLSNKASKLDALEDKSDDTSQYGCRQCSGRFQLGR